MPRPRLVLASASVGRLGVLRAAGLDPEVVVSGVDESVLAAPDTASLVRLLAEAKAAAVAPRVDGDALVLGCDSLLDLDGVAHGKPADAAQAVRWWRERRGRDGVLCTGHALLQVAGGQVRRTASATVTTAVRFGSPGDAEIDAYVASGEPLAVAGAFTLEGRSAGFLRGVDGDPLNVIGISPAWLRGALAGWGIAWTDLWTQRREGRDRG